MRVIPPLTVTEAMLTATSVVETAPAAYNGGTTYALNATVSVAAGTVLSAYTSLQASNTGNTPASSPAWWALTGSTYAVYSGATTYALGDIVIDPTNHLEYESLVASNLGNALTDTAKWLLLGPTNRWKMFDLLRNTGSTGPSPLTVEITPGRRIDSIALVGLIADTVQVTMTSGATTVYDVTLSLTTRNTVTWKGYFFGTFEFMPTVALFDLPPYASAVLTITLTRASGDASCGGVILGTSLYLGQTQVSAESDARNFSTVDYDTFGRSLLTQRRTVPKTSQTVVADKSAVNLIRQVREDLNAVPAFWSWLDDQDDDYFDAGVILGPYTQFMLTMDQPGKDLVTIALQVQEV